MQQYSYVETTDGRLRGGYTKGVHQFKGIPYGADTGGAMRFTAPQRPKSWRGIRDALQPGPMCPQHNMPAQFDDEILRLLSGGFEMPSVVPNENCLVLNVWTPQPRDGGRRPVMVWCHGGRFSEGSGGNAWCDGSALAKLGDVVVVTLNHRLNMFGYLYPGEIDTSHGSVSVNAGMLDIVAGLAWIRDNIAQFGGDARNVTLFGNSGGGAKISTLMAMPSARGLFHKAIVQSSPLRGSSGTTMRQRHITTALLAQLGLGSQQWQALQRIPHAQLKSAMIAVETRLNDPRGLGIFAPTMDGNILPEHPFEFHAPALGDSIPLLIGTNSDETTLMLGKPAFSITHNELPAFIQRWAGTDHRTAERWTQAYRDVQPAASPSAILFALTTDIAVRSGAIQQADYKSLQSASVYMYLFRWRIPAYEGRFGAMHGAEVPFVFGNVDQATGFQATPQQYHSMQQKITLAWISFARHGNPNHAALPFWPTYDVNTRSTLCFGQDTLAGRDDLTTSEHCEVISDLDQGPHRIVHAIKSQ